MNQAKIDDAELEITEAEVVKAADEIVEELVSEDIELSEKKKVKEKKDIEITSDDDEYHDEEDEDDVEVNEKSVEFLRLTFADNKTVKKVDKWINKNVGQEFGSMLPDESGNSIEFEDLDDADGLMSVLKKAGFKFKVDMKESTEDKIDMSVDVDALLEGEDFSDDFKLKATTIFEAAIGAKLASEKLKLEESFESKLEESIIEFEETLSNKVDSYLSYVVEEWSKDNEIALEHGIRSEISEGFLDGMRDLFVENFIDIPEEKLSIVESQFDEIEELTEKLNEAEKEKMSLFSQVNESMKDRILLSLSEDLAVTETEKFKELAENVDFESSELYEKKLNIIKETYFPTDKKVGNVEVEPSNVIDVSDNMAAYMTAISKQV